MIEKAEGGIDTILATSDSYILLCQVENLTYAGAGNFTGTGNLPANILTGWGARTVWSLAAVPGQLRITDGGWTAPSPSSTVGAFNAGSMRTATRGRRISDELIFRAGGFFGGLSKSASKIIFVYQLSN